MTTSRVTQPVDEEGADIEKAGGATVSVRGRFDLSLALLRLTVAASMAHMTEK